ncbi:MAG: BatD family protein [Flammeovirgaceae bacterium]|nr:BatD family protein [Flammeovirgaceae bacterium]
MNSSKVVSILIFSVLSVVNIEAYCQNISIKLGRATIGVNETFQITFTVENERFVENTPFPEIAGFIQQGTSSSKSTNYVNGKISSTESVTQNYLPTGQGTFVLQAFSIEINGEKVSSPGTTIKVGPAVNQQKQDPFAEFWGAGKNNDNQQYVNVQDDAFFAITSNKKKIYVGESFNLNVSFFISLKNRAKMDFYKISDQLGDILKKVKPDNCWEENFGIDQINPEYITLNGKQYTQYKIYQASFFPLTSKDIDIPSAGLKMIKYKVAKNPSFFGRNMQEDYKSFYSKPIKIRVLDLPENPLKSQVNVGNYQLSEKVSAKILETGKSYQYQFTISGEGNVAAIKPILLPEGKNFDIYPPAISQKVNRANNRVFGYKSFRYQIQPREPGEYNLSDYFKWVYFNSKTGKYETLESDIIVQVIGESKRENTISSTGPTGFYEKIELASNNLSNRNTPFWFTIGANISLIVILITLGVVATRRNA